MTTESSICRTCLTKQSKMYSFFTDIVVEDTLNYAKMLECVSAIQVSEEDGLPNSICDCCSKTLYIAYTFKQQCEQADSWLHENLDDTVAFDFKQSTENIEIHCNVMNNAEVLVEDLNGNDHIEQNANKIITDKKKYTCVECNKHFLKNSQLYTHKRSHKQYKCELCSQYLRSPHGLRYHMKNHQGLKNYVCNYENCSKSFINKQGLDKHKHQHTTEKNQLCNVCGKKFYTAGLLQSHLRAHRNDRPYLCTQCGQTFKQVCHLKSHMWCHTGTKPYLCSSCGRRYTSGHQLKKHLSKYCGAGILPPEKNANLKVRRYYSTPRRDERNCLKIEDEEDVDIKAVKLEMLEN